MGLVHYAAIDNILSTLEIKSEFHSLLYISVLCVYIHIDFAILLLYAKIVKGFLNLYRPFFFGHGIFGIYGIFIPQPGTKPVRLEHLKIPLKTTG